MGGGEVRVGSGIEYDSNKRELVVLLILMIIIRIRISLLFAFLSWKICFLELTSSRISERWVAYFIKASSCIFTVSTRLAIETAK